MPVGPGRRPDDPGPDHRDMPTYWFAVLEIARERNDFETAARAQRQLRRLGVRVTYESRGKGREVPHVC